MSDLSEFKYELKDLIHQLEHGKEADKETIIWLLKQMVFLATIIEEEG